jgi:hypothetical protein
LNLFLLSLISFLQLSYLVHHRELADPAFTAPWIANLRQRTLISTVVVLAWIVLSYYKPHLAIDAYWLLMVFHFLPGKHRRPPEVHGQLLLPKELFLVLEIPTAKTGRLNSSSPWLAAH